MPTETTPKPLRVGVISAGSTHVIDDAACTRAWPLIAREDVAEAELPDYGVLSFLSLLTAVIGKLHGGRGLELAVFGGAQTRPDMRAAFARLIERDVDIISFWTFSPLALPGAPVGEAAYDDLINEAVRRDMAVVFPAATGFAARCAGLIGCGGVVAAAPFLDAVAVPPGWPNAQPLISSWGEWSAMRTAWIGAADVGDALPESVPFPFGLSLPVWSVTVMLAWALAIRQASLTISEKIDVLASCCGPVTVRPEALTPQRGFLEPRLMPSILLKIARANAAAQHSS